MPCPLKVKGPKLFKMMDESGITKIYCILESLGAAKQIKPGFIFTFGNPVMHGLIWWAIII